jgi:hypothetical protein
VKQGQKGLQAANIRPCKGLRHPRKTRPEGRVFPCSGRVRTLAGRRAYFCTVS